MHTTFTDVHGQQTARKHHPEPLTARRTSLQPPDSPLRRPTTGEPPARRPSLQQVEEENKQHKTMRLKKIVQLTPQQVRQLQQGGPGVSPRAGENAEDIEGEKAQEEQKQEQQEEAPQVNFNVYPYYYDVVKNHQLLKSSNLKDQIRGAQEIGEVAWNGGELSQTFIGKCGVLVTLAALLDTDQLLKLKIVMSLSVVCRGHPEIQDKMTDLNFVQRLYTAMCDHNEEMRKWATHALFYLLNGCEKAHTAAKQIHELKHRLEVIARDNWTNWNYNDAKEILKMLRLRAYDED